MSWFKKTPPPTPTIRNDLPTAPVVYPAGTAVVTETAKYLINKDGKKYRIQSDAIFHSWRFPLVVTTSDIAVSKYPTAVTKLGFRDGTLLNNIADGKLYLVSDNKLRHITSPEVLTRLQRKQDRAVVVSQDDINIMRIGETLS